METLELVLKILILLAVIGFACYTTWLIIRHTGPDESQSRTRYHQMRFAKKKTKQAVSRKAI